MNQNESIEINLAAYLPQTTVLGPGNRAVVWVQGCPFHCKGCIAPDWIPFNKRFQIKISKLAEMILAETNIQGLTISGGEPMMQASGLYELVKAIKNVIDLDIICYTGFRLERLLESPPERGVPEFLRYIDVLIDGPYQQELNNDIGLRGSTNQRIHYLTNRLMDYDFENSSRKISLNVNKNEISIVGVPTKNFMTAFNKAIDSIGIQNDRIK
jgi:anaerobic ribonucleoside-triphosphate reductase activating protein